MFVCVYSVCVVCVNVCSVSVKCVHVNVCVRACVPQRLTISVFLTLSFVF